MPLRGSLPQPVTIKKMLEANGHSVAGEAGNGVEAVKKYMEIKPDVVLLDITMPEMNGVDALKRILCHPVCQSVIICLGCMLKFRLQYAVWQ